MQCRLRLPEAALIAGSSIEHNLDVGLAIDFEFGEITSGFLRNAISFIERGSLKHDNS